MKKRADGRYQKAITINGRKQFFYGKSPADVNKKILAYEEKQEQGRLFKEVAEEWYDNIVNEISPTTERGYLPAKNDAINKFGDVPIKEITTIQINNYLLEFKVKGYAYKTVLTKLQIIRQICDFSILKGDILINPAIAVKIPKNLPRTTREVPDQADIEKIKRSDCLVALIALYTGCRKGEIFALSSKDIDFETNEITINKSVYYKNNRAYIKQPKTKAGIRTIPLLEPLKTALQTAKIKGDLFINDKGELLTEKQARKLWLDFCAQYDVKCTMHQLRHAYATRLYELDIDEKSAQDLMGHADIQTTKNIYTHISNMKRKVTADKLSKF